MRNQPRPAFVAEVLNALPADGAPLSSRGVWLAIGKISTPGYIRIVLRDLTVSGQIIGTGPSSARVYRRLPDRLSVNRVPAGGEPEQAESPIHECA